MNAANTVWDFSVMLLIVGSVSSNCCLVDCMFLRTWSRWPFAVARDFCRCLVTLAEVNPGQVEKWLALIACIQVLVVGQKHALWKNVISSPLVLVSMTTLAVWAGGVGSSFGSVVYHKPGDWRWPCRMILLFLVTLTLLESNVAVQP